MCVYAQIDSIPRCPASLRSYSACMFMCVRLYVWEYVCGCVCECMCVCLSVSVYV